MKLVFIKKTFSIHGGAERYLQTLIKELRQKGHEIHIFAAEWEKEEGIVFHRVKTLPYLSFLSTVTFNTNVKREITRNIKPDCVISFERTTCQDIYRAGEGCHAEWLKKRAYIEPFLKRLSFKINPLHLSLLMLERKLFETTPLIIANSNMVKEQIRQNYSVQDSKVKIIYNGVDLKRFSPENRVKWYDSMRESLSISRDSPVLLFVGSGYERKGLHTLIDSLPLLKEEGIKVLVIGKGNIDRYMAQAQESAVPEKILFLGSQKEIEKYYAAADVFVLPTLYDPFSNATLEAMASGLPVITTKNNGAAEFVENGQEGYVLDNLFDREELAYKISLSLKNREKMTKDSRKKAEAFPIEKAAKEFTEAILTIVH